MTVKVEGHHRCVLRHARAHVLLERLLHRWPAGAEGSAAFPDDYDGIVAGAPANPRTRLAFATMWIAHANLKDPRATSRPQVSGHSSSGAEGLRRAGRRERRADHRSHALPFRSAAIACKARRRSDCLTAPQMEAVQEDSLALAQSAHRRRNLLRTWSRARTWLGHAGRSRAVLGHHRSISLRGIQESEVGLAHVELR